ncbi:hypothetical protein [Roseibium alexandrii]|uniref:Uncharacterized protein n=1 Tax=Roseibium alexandrii (strain DSM 17067 / NCIMB 14079 / DFL-11) TaxID=244592 RepID=A0A5E8H153_ROSAD|nr:hypothetical protein [Roseibium alexandrii]EEE46174.2 hypothetical protein SADFL11_3463 [Roseibium alexandrii DFL-11]
MTNNILSFADAQAHRKALETRDSALDEVTYAENATALIQHMCAIGQMPQHKDLAIGGIGAMVAVLEQLQSSIEAGDNATLQAIHEASGIELAAVTAEAAQ